MALPMPSEPASVGQRGSAARGEGREGGAVCKVVRKRDAGDVGVPRWGNPHSGDVVPHCNATLRTQTHRR
jgi:hypothetical protein